MEDILYNSVAFHSFQRTHPRSSPASFFNWWVTVYLKPLCIVSSSFILIYLSHFLSPLHRHSMPCFGIHHSDFSVVESSATPPWRYLTRLFLFILCGFLSCLLLYVACVFHIGMIGSCIETWSLMVCWWIAVGQSRPKLPEPFVPVQSWHDLFVTEGDAPVNERLGFL